MSIHEGWMEWANCLVEDPADVSFITKPDEITERRWQRICKTCPVQLECLEWSDEQKVTGVYAAGEWRE